MKRRLAVMLASAAALLPGLAAPVAAETNKVRIGIQYGLTYLPFAVIEHESLIQKAAAAAGLPGLSVTFIRSAGGDSMNEGSSRTTSTSPRPASRPSSRYGRRGAAGSMCAGCCPTATRRSCW